MLAKILNCPKTEKKMQELQFTGFRQISNIFDLAETVAESFPAVLKFELIFKI